MREAVPVRLLVVGASGLVGSALVRAARGEGVEVLGSARHLTGDVSRVVDLGEPDSLQTALNAWRPSHVAVCAAYAHVDGCERDPERSRLENVQTVQNLIQATRAAGTRLLFYSSDHVFDGTREHDVEADPVHPLSVYARHKREAEELLLAEGRALILRTSWVFGEELRRKNFVYQTVRSARSGERWALPVHQSGCPTWSTWLAELTIKLVREGLTGVVHASSSELLSKAEWARLIGRELELPPLRIEEVPWEQAGQVAPRPARVALLSTKHTVVHPPLSTILKAERAVFLAP